MGGGRPLRFQCPKKQFYQNLPSLKRPSSCAPACATLRTYALEHEARSGSGTRVGGSPQPSHGRCTEVHGRSTPRTHTLNTLVAMRGPGGGRSGAASAEKQLVKGRKGPAVAGCAAPVTAIFSYINTKLLLSLSPTATIGGGCVHRWRMDCHCPSTTAVCPGGWVKCEGSVTRESASGRAPDSPQTGGKQNWSCQNRLALSGWEGVAIALREADVTVWARCGRAGGCGG